MDLAALFKETLPYATFIDLSSQAEEIESVLRANVFLKDDEHVQGLEKPGEGNMNLVLRIKTNQRSFILKQARPWVQKYPQIPAPENRVHVEAAFYQAIEQKNDLFRYMPRLLRHDSIHYLLITEDLGESADFTFLYKRKLALSDNHTFQLLDFLNQLHHLRVDSGEFPNNLAMRKLNHEHIFHFPFLEENGFDLNQVQEGLAEVAKSFKTNHALTQKAKALGDVYLTTGETLIHGDYYPGSWLQVGNDVKVIDPEFAYVGKAEFDLGVWMAHLYMAGEPEDKSVSILDGYDAQAFFDRLMMWQFCGIEILRRLIGLAQLPISIPLEEKEALLNKAVTMVLQPQKVEA